MSFRRKTNTKMTVDQILDGGADILEQFGWVTGSCAAEDGGHCALGALAQAVYPKATPSEIEELSYVNRDDRHYESAAGRPKDPRHVEAVAFLGERIRRSDKDRFSPRRSPEEVIFHFNDDLPDGVECTYPTFEDGRENYLAEPVRTVDRKVYTKSLRAVVSRMRNAAKAYRKQQAKVAA